MNAFAVPHNEQSRMGVLPSVHAYTKGNTTVARNTGYTRDLVAFRNVGKIIRDQDDNFTPQMWAILIEIALTPGLTMQELAQRCDLALSSVSRNLMALGEWHRFGKPGLGLVEKTEDPAERRRQIAFLTPKGRKMVEQMISTLHPNEAVNFEAPTAREWLNKAYRARS